MSEPPAKKRKIMYDCDTNIENQVQSVNLNIGSFAQNLPFNVPVPQSRPSKFAKYPKKQAASRRQLNFSAYAPGLSPRPQEPNFSKQNTFSKQTLADYIKIFIFKKNIYFLGVSPTCEFGVEPLPEDPDMQMDSVNKYKFNFKKIFKFTF